MNKTKALQMLTMMEAITGSVIPKKQRIQTKVIDYPTIGMFNKKCPNCGHKNKK